MFSVEDYSLFTKTSTQNVSIYRRYCDFFRNCKNDTSVIWTIYEVRL